MQLRPTPSLLAQAAALLALVACRAVPPPAPPAPLGIPEGLAAQVESFAGSPLTGPRAVPAVPADAARPLVLTVEGLLLAAAPRELSGLGLESLSGATELVLAPERRAAVQPTARLFAGARIGAGAAAEAAWGRLVDGEFGEAVPLEALGPVPLLAGRTPGEGLAAGLAWSLSEEVIDPDNFLNEHPDRPPAPKTVGLRAGRASAGEVDWVLVAADARPRRDREEPLGPTESTYRLGSPAPLLELLRPTLVPAPGAPVLVTLPSPFEGQGQGVALLVRVAELDTDVEPEGLADLLATLRADAGARAEGSSRRGPLARAVDTALAGLERHVGRGVDAAASSVPALVTPSAAARAALVYLSGAHTTPLAMHLAVVADDATLDAWAAAVVAERAAAQGIFDPSWTVERTAWLLLARRALEEGLVAGESALLVRHGGAVGRHPSLAEELVLTSPDLATFKARLVAENLVFLEDTGPSSRVRALDWLTARGDAPAGYDPLAPRATRRAALEAAAAAQGGTP